MSTIAKKKQAKVNKKVKSVSKSKTVKSKAKKTSKKDVKKTVKEANHSTKETKLLESYTYEANNMPISVRIYRKKGEFVPIYEVSISSITKHTEIIIEKIRQELIKEVNLGMADIINSKQTGFVEERFKETIEVLIEKYFPDADEKTIGFLTTYLIQKSLGMGNIEILNNDPNLEEIAINSADEPVWVYHRSFGWLKSNITVPDEEQTKHYSAMIGRKVGRQITMLNPLMDANLTSGDRVNATIMPISNRGNTITLRKFASKAWTITDFLKSNTIDINAAAMIWEGVQYELSALVAGGTATGKTSMLNVVSNFFPPNQRILSIEDTREIRLPKFLHWVPMVTRQPNPEGKGEVSMLDLLVNSLRQRPDRILVGEIRRKREAEVLFEAIHTGHSVYATVHANDTKETVTRLTSPPIEIPKSMIPAISMLIIQHRNRRTGTRRTFQISEITPEGDPNVLMQLDLNKDKMRKMNKSKSFYHTLNLFTGVTPREINKQLHDKIKVLKWLVKNDINTVNDVGRIMAEFYTNEDNLFKIIRKNGKFGDVDKS